MMAWGNVIDEIDPEHQAPRSMEGHVYDDDDDYLNLNSGKPSLGFLPFLSNSCTVLIFYLA